MFAVVEYVKADAALALTNGDGELSVSADQLGLPDTAVRESSERVKAARRRR